MYLAVGSSTSDWSELTFLVGLVLWPTSIMLMAIQHPGMILFSVVVGSLAVLSNALLYGLVFAFVCFLTDTVKSFRSR
jgi:hypothetical protein